MHCMLDLETMGTDPGSVILSIGAIAFDPIAGTVGDDFYVNIDVLSCLMVGLRVNDSTQDWWMKQDSEASAVLFKDRESLRSGLMMFSTWFKKNGCEQVWANGPVADVAWMEAAYRAVGLSYPWTHREPRCYRTIVELAGLGREERSVPRVKHDALEDATAQAMDVITCYERLGLCKKSSGSSSPNT